MSALGQKRTRSGMITLSTPHPRQRGPLLAPVVVDRVAWRDTPCKGTGNAKCDAAQYELSRHSYHEGMIHSRSGAMRQYVASPCVGRRLQQSGNSNGVVNRNMMGLAAAVDPKRSPKALRRLQAGLSYRTALSLS